MGQGLTHVARLMLDATAVQDGVLLVDEVENGLHHAVLPDIWRAVRTAAEQFNVQVFATTHSFECLQAGARRPGARRLPPAPAGGPRRDRAVRHLRRRRALEGVRRFLTAL